jgi:hypothetical protein
MALTDVLMLKHVGAGGIPGLGGEPRADVKSFIANQDSSSI